MVAVVLSGVIGRFIYIQIPRTIQGHELDYNELQELNENLTKELENKYQFSSSIISQIENDFKADKYYGLSFLQSLKVIVMDFINLRKKLRIIKKELIQQNIKEQKSIKNTLKIIKSKMILLRRIGLLKTMQKLFNYWHIVHLPFAISMFVIMLLHVGVTILFGYRWIF